MLLGQPAFRPLLIALMATLAFAPAQAADYQLDLRPDFDRQLLQAHARIDLAAVDRPAGPLTIFSPAIEITRATADGVEVVAQRSAAGWQIGSVAFNGQVVEIDYHAAPSPGLVFAADHVYTAFHTCQWMPCIGSDLSRATAVMRIDLPAGFRAVASGRVSTTSDVSVQRWVQAQPVPLYTLGFAAGRFTEVDEVDGNASLRLLGAGIDAAGLRSRFHESARVLAFMQERAGVPLPTPVYTQVLVPGDVAQEASSFSMIGRRWLDPITEDPQEDWVIVHEMAHQWWGNLVTCAHWSELWLDEGLAVYMTAAWKQHRWGEAAYQHEMALARERWERAREAGFDKPLNWAGDYPTLRTRRDIQYGKAAVFLQTLREQLGDAVFWAGLRRYTRDNVGRNVGSLDFRLAMEASAGHSLQTLFDQWIE